MGLLGRRERLECLVGDARRRVYQVECDGWVFELAEILMLSLAAVSYCKWSISILWLRPIHFVTFACTLVSCSVIAQRPSSPSSTYHLYICGILSSRRYMPPKPLACALPNALSNSLPYPECANRSAATTSCSASSPADRARRYQSLPTDSRSTRRQLQPH